MPGELILLVDDEPNIIELAKLYLEREGFRTIAVGDGQSAIDRAAKDKPALMVLDLMLPQAEPTDVRVSGTIISSQNESRANSLSVRSSTLKPGLIVQQEADLPLGRFGDRHKFLKECPDVNLCILVSAFAGMRQTAKPIPIVFTAIGIGHKLTTLRRSYHVSIKTHISWERRRRLGRR